MAMTPNTKHPVAFVILRHKPRSSSKHLQVQTMQRSAQLWNNIITKWTRNEIIGTY